MTETQIANLALRKIVNLKVVDLTANAQLEEEIRDHIVQIRQDLIRSHVWSFATKRGSLSTTTAPTFGESYAYALPNDYMQLTEAWLQSDMRTRISEFRIEGKTLVTDYQSAFIIYVADITDPADWTPDFRSCIIYKLAIALCPHFNIDENVQRRLESDYENIRRPRAMINNALEDTTHEYPSEKQSREQANLNRSHDRN